MNLQCMAEAKLVLTCQDGEEVRTALWPSYLASEHIRESIALIEGVGANHDANAPVEFRHDASSFRADAVQHVLDHIERTPRAVFELNTRADTPREVVLDRSAAIQRILNPRKDPEPGPTWLDYGDPAADAGVMVLHVTAIGDVVRFADMMGYTVLVQDIMHYVAKHPTIAGIAAIDAVRREDATWARDRVLQLIHRELDWNRERCTYYTQGKHVDGAIALLCNLGQRLMMRVALLQDKGYGPFP